MQVHSHKYQLVPAGSLFVDYHTSFEGTTIIPDEAHVAYQRNRKSVEDKIVKDGVNPDLFGALIVNTRSDGTYSIVDGGTRYRAIVRLNENNGNTKLPCLVHEWTLEQEIMNYIELNSQRLGIGSVDKFVAKVRLHDEQSIAIQELLRQETGKDISPNGFQCVYQIEHAYEFDLGATLRVSLQTIRELGWLAAPKGMTQYIVGGVSGVFELGAKQKRAATQWSQVGSPADVIEEGRKLSRLYTTVGYGGGSRSMAKAVAIYLGKEYNKGLRTHRLDLSPLIGETDE